VAVIGGLHQPNKFAIFVKNLDYAFADTIGAVLNNVCPVIVVGLHLRCNLVSHCRFKRVVYMIQKCFHVIALRVGLPWPGLIYSAHFSRHIGPMPSSMLFGSVSSRPQQEQLPVLRP